MPHFWQSVLVAVGALIVAPIVLALVQRFRMRTNFDYGMRVVAIDAVRRARQEYQVILDYSVESVQQLEDKILAKLHETHLQTPMSEQVLSVVSVRWGAYVGEVLKRTRAGKWRRDSERAGAGALPVVFGEGTEAFPRSWVYKRIVDGPEDNVAFKVQVFTNPQFRQQLASPAKPGASTTPTDNASA